MLKLWIFIAILLFEKIALFIDNFWRHIDKFFAYYSFNNKAMEDNNLINIGFENILKNCHNMIYSIINDIRRNEYQLEYPISNDDLYQEGCIALYNAYQSYHESTAKFTTFAYLVIKRRIQHKFKEYLRPLLHERYSYDSVRQLDYYTCYNKNNRQKYNTDYDLINHFISTIDKIDAKIVKARIDGITYQKIANDLNLKTKQVEYRLKKIKETFKLYLKKNNYY